MIRREVAEQTRGKPTAQYDGLKITHSEGRGWSISAAVESQERALAGDTQLLDERLQAGSASPGEQRLAADLLTGRIKSERKKLSQLLAADRRQLVVEFIRKREIEDPGVNRESFIQEAMDHFEISRSEVFTSLKEYGPK